MFGNEKKVCKLVKSVWIKSKHQNNGMRNLTLLFYLMDLDITMLINVFILNSLIVIGLLFVFMWMTC
jgi:hypothetical protein